MSVEHLPRAESRRRFLTLSFGATLAPGFVLAAGYAPLVTILGDSITAGYGLPASQAFPAQLQRAQEACQKYLPGGGPQALTPAQKAQMRQSELQIAQCMRKHGYPNFPDPDSQGVLDLPNIDPSSSQFQTAMQACRPSGGKGNIGIRIRAGGPGQ